MPNVTLGPYNTITVAAASGAYRLQWPAGGGRTLDMMNTGTGAVFLRADSVNSTVNDANSLQLPPNWAINGLKVDGGAGLSVIAAADTTISVRMT